MRGGFVEDAAAEKPLELTTTGEPLVISAWGKKGRGKSYFNRRIFRSYPGDKIAIDINGNADPGPDAEKITLPEGTAPRWPEKVRLPGEEKRSRTLHFVAKPHSATFHDDLDRAVGLALFPQAHRVCLWAGEVGELTPHTNSGPHMRTVLMQNRHFNVDCLFDGPRPADVDKLVLGQSDLIAVFFLPDEDDRKRIAKQCGIPVRDFERECREVWRRGKHHFLLWHTDSETLFRCPPLPDDLADPALEDTAAGAPSVQR